MKVALIALSVRGAMGQYLEALARSLSEHIELHVFAPTHFDSTVRCAVQHSFPTGATRLRALWSFLNPWMARRIWREMKALKPDVVHLLNGEGYPWSILWASWARLEHIPLVVTVHDPEPHPSNFVEALNALLRRGVLHRASRVHIHSARFLETMLQQGIPSERVKVIPIGSPAERFTRHRREGISREPLALFFGRLEAYKGLDVLVEAGLKGALKIVIAGPGKVPRRLQKTIQNHPEIFELHNSYVDDAEAARLFQRAAVCVLPYRQATQSSVPLIAAAFGVPVVASAIGAFVEDVPLVNGLLVPPGDSQALAEKIPEAIERVPHYPKEREYATLCKDFLAMYRGISRL